MNSGPTGPGTLLLLLVAGVGAGVTGSTAGLASLISYPALLAVGLPPVTANVTNTVALIGSSIGSVSGSRAELRGQGRDIRRYTGLAAIAGALGATLLLIGPAGTFQQLVPYLIAGASILLLLSPRLRAIRAGRADPAAAPRGPRGDGSGGAVLHLRLRRLLRRGGRRDDPGPAAVRHRQDAAGGERAEESASGCRERRRSGGFRDLLRRSAGCGGAAGPWLRGGRPDRTDHRPPGTADRFCGPSSPWPGWG